MRAIFRNFFFVLKRFKTSSILNILGLSAAFAVFSVVIIQADYDFSFNQNFSKSARIFHFSIQSPGLNYDNMNMPLLQKIGTSLPEIKNYCIMHFGQSTVIKTENKKYNDRIIRTTPGFLSVFTPEIIAGDAQEVFVSKNKVMISESSAKKYFGNDNPLGQMILLKDSIVPFTVAAIYRDFPKNCLLKNAIYTGLFENSPYNFSFRGYFEIQPGDIPYITQKLNSKQFQGEDIWNRLHDDPKATRKIELTSLISAHFNFPENEYLYFNGEPTLSIKSLLSFLAIGIITLVIAYINFLNFAVALAPIRVRNMNIQKIMGASNLLMRIHIICESAFFSFSSFLISLFFIYAFGHSSVTRFFTADISLLQNIPVLCVIGLFSLSFGIISGCYPAFYITSFHPNVATSGLFSFSRRNKSLRNTLITIQFISAIVLLITSVIIQRQHSFMQNRPIGIEKDNVLCLQTEPIKTRLKVFEEELKQNPRIIDCTASANLPGQVSTQLGEMFEGTQVMAYWWPVRENFLRFFRIKVIDGRDFISSDSVGRHGIIFNKEFVRRYKLKDITGKNFGNHSFKYDYKVVGTATDINFLSLRDSIYPMAFSLEKDVDFNWIFIKISDTNVPSTIDFIKKTWQKYSDEDFEPKFLDTSIDELYKNENNLANLLFLFGIVIILIAMMGVYGLIVFNTRYQAKEIALRKVNGASISEIMLMLNRNILILLSLAYIVGVPIAYYVVHRWLQQFAYKTPIYWWVFALAGLLVLLITIITVSWQSYKAATANPVEAIQKE